MKRALRALVRLSPEERTATCEAALLLFALRLGLRISPAAVTRRLLSRACAPVANDKQANPEKVATVVHGVERVARRLPNGTCLPQALAGWVMLRRRSVPAVVRLGARYGPAALDAHAWLEHDGRIVLGGEGAENFVRFDARS